MHDHHHHHCRKRTFWDRRNFLFQSGGGIAGLALAHMLEREGMLAAAPADGCGDPVPGNPFAPKAPHFEPRATAVISLFMSGGVSQVDTFDYKPALTEYAGQPMAESVVVRQGHPGPLMPSPFEFHRHGESGLHVSEIFPHLSKKVDEMAFIRSLYGRSNDHIQATYEMQSGQIRMGFPAVGSWVTYGLGSESSSLPAFVVMNDYRGGPLGGPNDWSAGFMPAAYQGTLFRAVGDPIVDLQPPEGMTVEQQRARLDTPGPAQRDGHGPQPGQLGARGPHLVLRARLPHAGLRARGGRHLGRVRGHEEALRPRRGDHRAVRAAVPDGAPARRARRPLRAALPRRPRRPEHRHLGRPTAT